MGLASYIGLLQMRREEDQQQKARLRGVETLYSVSQKKGNPFSQDDIFIEI